MKTYKQFFETADAKDYVVPKDDDDEAKDIKPRSKGERKFKDSHKVNKKKHPTADDSVHTGDIKKVKKEEVELDEKAKVKEDDDEVVDDDDDDDEDDEEDDDEEDDDEEEIDEDVLDSLEDIAKKHQAKRVKFSNKKSMTVDAQTANAMVNMFKKLNDQNKKKMRPFIDKSPENFMQLLDLAFGGGKK